jgi:hypothetical protein
MPHAAHVPCVQPFGDAASTNVTENQLWIDGVRELFRRTKQAAPQTLVFGYSQEATAVGGWRVGLSDVEELVADGFIDAWVDQSWAGAWEDVPTRFSKTTGWTFHLPYILIHRAMIEGGNRRRPSGTPRCKHYVLHGLFDAYEGFDTLHKVPLKLQWGVWAYALAALVRPTTDGGEAGGDLRFADGHYASWANSYSYVTGSITNPLDDDSYLDRPTGLITCTDVAWLCGVLDGADAAVAGVTEVSGPTVLYDRAALAAVMASAPADNVNEWVDEQLGIMLKYGLPLLKVGRIEDGVDPTVHRDGVVLSIPTSVSGALVANLTALAATGAPVVILGRCDRIDPALLALVDARCSTTTGVDAPYYGPARFAATGTTANISLSRHVRVTAGPNADAASVETLPNGNVVMVGRGTTMYAQLNDYTSPVTSNLAVQNYGHVTAHYTLASGLVWPPIRDIVGLTTTRPITLHTWSEGTGTRGILAGNLEGNHCNGLPCSVPTELGGRAVTVSLDTRSTAPRWLCYSLDPAVRPTLLTSVGGVVNVTIELALSASRVYMLTAMG